MTRKGCWVPVKRVGKAEWGQLTVLHAGAHEICGEKVEKIDDNFSFAGGHRVRLYRFKKNVHWRIPDDVKLDISGVEPPSPQRRQD